MPRTPITTSYTPRTEPTTIYTERLSPWRYCMNVIITGLWDDTKNWEDNLIWWDDWEKWTWYNTRPLITTTYG